MKIKIYKNYSTMLNDLIQCFNSDKEILSENRLKKNFKKNEQNYLLNVET